MGIVALQLGQILSGLENAGGDKAIYPTAAVNRNNEVTTSHLFSIDPANTYGQPYDYGEISGVTMVLTAGTNVISPLAAEAKHKATALQDVILATTAGQLATADSIDARGGADLLGLYWQQMRPLLQP